MYFINNPLSLLIKQNLMKKYIPNKEYMGLIYADNAKKIILKKIKVFVFLLFSNLIK